MHFPIESKVILWPKKEKTIRTNPNKVQLFKLFYGKNMGRPSNPSTKYFQRTLSDPQRMILLAAGKGNLCRGFENVLDLYSEAHSKGFRPDMPVSILNIRSETTNSPNVDQSIVGKVREDIGNG